MHVSDLMTAPARTCRPGDSLATAARLMWENDLGLVPVLDDSNRVVATVSDRDLCMGAYTQGKALGELRVRDTMSSRIVTCGVEDSIEEALVLMGRERVRRLPVLDATGKLAGMLSLADVARALGKQAGLAPVLLRTFVAISTPHGDAPEEPVKEIEPRRKAAKKSTGSKKSSSKKGTTSKKRAVKKTSTRKKTGR